MIDFSKITKTVGGLNCYYLGQRKSGDQVVHRFAIVNDAGELICYYNDQGQRIEFSDAGGWLVNNNGHQIIAPPKIVEITRWVGLCEERYAPGEYFVDIAEDEQRLIGRCLAKQQHTFRFEVPNE